MSIFKHTTGDPEKLRIVKRMGRKLDKALDIHEKSDLGDAAETLWTVVDYINTVKRMACNLVDDMEEEELESMMQDITDDHKERLEKFIEAYEKIESLKGEIREIRSMFEGSIIDKDVEESLDEAACHVKQAKVLTKKGIHELKKSIEKLEGDGDE